MFWGFSESLDLYAEYLNAQKASTTANNARTKTSASADADAGGDENSTLSAEPTENADNTVSVSEDSQTPRADGGRDEISIPSVENSSSDFENIQTSCAADQEADVKYTNLSVVDTEQHLASPNGIDSMSEDISPSEARMPNTDEADEKNTNIDNASGTDSYASDSSPSDTQIPTSTEAGNKHTIPTAVNPDESVPQLISADSSSPAQTLNVLLFGAGDPRHLIKTLAKLYTHVGADGQWPFVNFYVLEGCTEIVARSLTLLSIALESADTFNLLTKVHLFMDVYGNSLLRPSSHQYLVGKSKAVLKLITDDDALQKLAPLLKLDNLKYRERDGLENMFNFLLPREGHVFDIQTYWTQRLRNNLTTRYDYREGAFDWDLNMVLKDRNGAQICSQEYRYWRETGIAFTYPEYEQCKPNKTFSVGLVRNGEKFLHRGYAGDIQTGPFCAFGLKCDDPRMLKSIHGENDYRSTDVTERNLLEYFHELQTATPYEHNVEVSRKYGSVKLLMGNRLTWNECNLDVRQGYEKPWLPVKGAVIHLLSADEIFTLQNNEERWTEFFDVAFVGHNYFAFVKETFSSLLKENALLVLETKLMTVARKEEVNAFEDKLKNFAKRCQLTPVINYNALNTKNSILKFKKCTQP